MAQTRTTQTQKRRSNGIVMKATPAWLVTDQDLEAMRFMRLIRVARLPCHQISQVMLKPPPSYSSM